MFDFFQFFYDFFCNSSECRDDVFCCEINPSHTMVAVGTGKGIVKIYKLTDGTNLYALVDAEVRRKYLPAVSVSWIGDTKLLAGYAAGYIKIWNISNQECIKTIEEDRTILQTCVTPDNDAFITSGKDSCINIYRYFFGNFIISDSFRKLANWMSAANMRGLAFIDQNGRSPNICLRLKASP